MVSQAKAKAEAEPDKKVVGEEDEESDEYDIVRICSNIQDVF